MDLDNLYLFIEVVQQGSFAKVARIRNIDPSSVSRAIAKLEAELGIRLFQRSTRKLETTEIGRIYFQQVAPLIDELESAKQIAIAIHQKPQGILRITAGSTFAQEQIVPLLPKFAELYPDLSVELILTDSYLDLIEERIDVAIRLGTLQDSSYMVKHLRKMNFYICASPDYLSKHGQPRNPQNIINHNCLLFPRARYSLDWVFKDGKGNITEIPIKGKYLLTNSLAIKQCAIAGMGLALLPDWLVDRNLKSGKLIRLFAEYDVTATNFDSSIWLLYPSRAYIPAKTQVFIDYIFKNFGKTKSQQ